MEEQSKKIATATTQPKTSICKCKNKIRWFNSKRAFLILIWTILVSIGTSSLINMLRRYGLKFSVSHFYWLAMVPCIIGILALIAAGLLADKKFGYYMVFRFSLVVLFLGTLVFSIFIQTQDLSIPVVRNGYFIDAIFIVVTSLMAVGLACISVTAIQLGVDQMPDASSSEITSFIAWFVFSIYAGFWISGNLIYTYQLCIDQTFNATKILSFHPVAFISVVLCSDFIFAKNWLIIEPKSAQSWKIIYLVLKFAYKYKAPINRSALTYWEENVPSRLDLGKSKYGGPFTIEQVEDVKTILRLLVVSLSLWVIAASLYIQPQPYIIPVNNTTSGCSANLLATFTYDPMWSPVIITMIQELCVYPLVRDKIPTIIKRIGITSFLLIPVSIMGLILELNFYFDSKQLSIIWTANITYSLSTGILSQMFICAVLELALAQAPYSMRGFLGGYMATPFVLAIVLASKSYNFYPRINERLALVSTKLAVSLLGFIVYCIVASWYKRRARDDGYNAHRVVEEVYDRYLTAEYQHRNNNV